MSVTLKMNVMLKRHGHIGQVFWEVQSYQGQWAVAILRGKAIFVGVAILVGKAIFVDEASYVGHACCAHSSFLAPSGSLEGGYAK